MRSILPTPAALKTATDEALRVAAAALSGDIYGWRHSSGTALVREVARSLGEPDAGIAYLLLACLDRRIPSSAEVVAYTRAWRSEGALAPLARAYAAVPTTRRESVIVATGIVVDVTDTGRSRFTTGIQRVARATITRWARDHDVTLVSWAPGTASLRTSSDDEITRVVLDAAERERIVRTGDAVVVPFRATFVLPEITVDGHRTRSIQTIARHSGSRTTAIGFDCIPVTTSETSGPGMPGAFSKYLAALASFDAIAAISDAAADEFRGWRRMLGGAGLEGPRVEAVPLPWQGEQTDPETVARVTKELGFADGQPVVLAVGSHEPRKNHLNLLTAAELAWRSGHRFHLAMVGGNAWGDHEFQVMVRRLRAAGRPISLLSGVPDETVWALYSLARFTVFCSINEGFGLPVAESLSVGTPVLTSDFGGMRQLGEGNGALIVDPHDVRAMAAEMNRLLTDDDLVAELRALTATLERPRWDDYADSLWALTTE